MNKYTIEDLILTTLHTDISKPNDPAIKKIVNVDNEIAADFFDDKSFMGVFPTIRFVISETDKQNPLVTCEISYFVAVTIQEIDNEETCKKDVLDCIIKMMPVQYINDINLILSKARYPEITLSDLSYEKEE